MEKSEKLKLFVNEFNLIKNANFRKFAEEVIANADDYFFVVPASSSGKYHPQFSLGDGGLVRHTRCVANFAKWISESLCMSEDDSDLLIIAALAHDIKKQGNGTKYTVHEHPLLASDYIAEIRNKFTEDEISEIQVQKICCAVASHMGKWGHNAEFIKGREPLPLPANEFEKALQIADYCASRKELKEFDFAQTENVQLPIIESKSKNDENIEGLPLKELENYIVDFGKHKGKTFKEIKETGYLEWMCKQEDFFKKDTQRAAKRYLYLLENNDNNNSVIVDNDDLPF